MLITFPLLALTNALSLSHLSLSSTTGSLSLSLYIWSYISRIRTTDFIKLPFEFSFINFKACSTWEEKEMHFSLLLVSTSLASFSSKSFVKSYDWEKSFFKLLKLSSFSQQLQWQTVGENLIQIVLLVGVASGDDCCGCWEKCFPQELDADSRAFFNVINSLRGLTITYNIKGMRNRVCHELRWLFSSHFWFSLQTWSKVTWK